MKGEDKTFSAEYSFSSWCVLSMGGEKGLKDGECAAFYMLLSKGPEDARATGYTFLGRGGMEWKGAVNQKEGKCNK